MVDSWDNDVARSRFLSVFVKPPQVSEIALIWKIRSKFRNCSACPSAPSLITWWMALGCPFMSLFMVLRPWTFTVSLIHVLLCPWTYHRMYNSIKSIVLRSNLVLFLAPYKSVTVTWPRHTHSTFLWHVLREPIKSIIRQTVTQTGVGSILPCDFHKHVCGVESQSYSWEPRAHHEPEPNTHHPRAHIHTIIPVHVPKSYSSPPSRPPRRPRESWCIGYESPLKLRCFF